jgi:hypothetical protein
MAYFKPSLPDDQPEIVTIVQRFQCKQDPNYGPKFPYTIKWNGTEYSHEATQTEEKTLQKFQVGQEAQVTKKQNAHGTMSMYWNEVPRGAPAMNQDAPAAPVYSTQNPPLPKKPEVDWDAIADSKILFGFMVAFIEQGKDEHQAYAKGMAAFRLHKKGETEMRTGVPSAPAVHSPEQLKEVDNAFGTDHAAPLDEPMVERND